jgi:hypothetical protein
MWSRPTISLAVSIAVRLGNDGGMTGGRPDLGGKTERRDVLCQMIGRRLAIPGKGRIDLIRSSANSRSRLLSKSASMRSRTG